MSKRIVLARTRAISPIHVVSAFFELSYHEGRRLFSAFRPAQRYARRPEPFVFPSKPNLAASPLDCQFFFWRNLLRTCIYHQAARNTCEIENSSLNAQCLFREESFDRAGLTLTDLEKGPASRAEAGAE